MTLGVRSQEKLNDMKILDVGCGRGGGLAFLSRYYSPSEAVGLDFSHQSIKFCNERFSEEENLTFQRVSKIDDEFYLSLMI